MTSSKKIKVTKIIEGLAPRGQAFVSHRGRKFYFGNLLPGDEITFELDANDKVLSLELIKPSKNRIKPDCQLHGPCGGCDLLELSEKARKAEKQNMIKRCVESLDSKDKVKINKFKGSKEITAFMPRVRLHQGRNYSTREAGYLVSENYRHEFKSGILPVKNCPILMKPLNKRIIAARRAMSQISMCLDSLVLMSSSSPKADRVTGNATLLKGKSHRVLFKQMQQIAKAAQLKGLSICDNTGKVRDVIGTVSVTGLVAPEVAGGPYESEPSFFVQGNIYQNKVLIDTVLELCGDLKNKNVVEGFAGAGNLTIPLAAEGAHVTAIESHPGAVRTANKNIINSKLESKINFIAGDAIKELKKVNNKPDLLLLDPPRSGTPNIGKIVKKLQPPKVILVFCDLEAMEKDSKQMIANGYKLTEVSGLDMYPRTHHVETVCKFIKGESAFQSVAV